LWVTIKKRTFWVLLASYHTSIYELSSDQSSQKENRSSLGLAALSTYGRFTLLT